MLLPVYAEIAQILLVAWVLARLVDLVNQKSTTVEETIPA